MSKYTGKEVAWTVIAIIGIILIFTLEVLWLQSMEVRKAEIKNCEPINYTSKDYLPKYVCSNLANDIWLCNMKETIKEEN
jgi:heme/copper-type cytochrome/quinol oxidase subunit 2